MGVEIGILALQGDYAAHRAACQRFEGVRTREVRRAPDLAGIDALILPGGESSAIFHLLDVLDLARPLADWLATGRPVLGTCAGAILLATRILTPERAGLGRIDMTVERNAYGRQIDSFIDVAERAAADLEGLECVFIRAPRIIATGAGVEVLARVHGDAVLVRQGNALAATFHPELSEDPRVHRLFIESLAPPVPRPRSATAAP